MTKDFKTQTASGSGSSFGQYGLGWMLGGVAIGILVGLAMYALTNKGNTTSAAAFPPGIPTAETTSIPNTGTNANLAKLDTPTETEPSEAHPSFSYHAVLPQLEVDIPLAVQAEQAEQAEQAANAQALAEKKAQAKDITTTAKDPKKEPAKETKPAPSKTLTGMNGFQIGSYKTEAQATAMYAHLKKNGLNARVEKADVNGVPWFRVRLGPAASADTFAQWQQTLSGMGISPLAVRM